MEKWYETYGIQLWSVFIEIPRFLVHLIFQSGGGTGWVCTFQDNGPSWFIAGRKWFQISSCHIPLLLLALVAILTFFFLAFFPLFCLFGLFSLCLLLIPLLPTFNFLHILFIFRLDFLSLILYHFLTPQTWLVTFTLKPKVLNK